MNHPSEQTILQYYGAIISITWMHVTGIDLAEKVWRKLRTCKESMAARATSWALLLSFKAATSER